jgi:hypothetical protein
MTIPRLDPRRGHLIAGSPRRARGASSCCRRCASRSRCSRDLHRLGDRHRGQAARAGGQQLRQPVRAVLGRRVRRAGLYAVYSAWWFLLILAFLVISTSLCIARNTPKIRRLRTYKENRCASSLKAFHHKAQGDCRRHRRRWHSASALLATRRLEGRCQVHARTARWWPPQGCGQQDRLPRRALGHRADLPGRPVRRRPVVRAQMALLGKRCIQRRRPGRPTSSPSTGCRQQPHLPRQPAGARGRRAGTAILNACPTAWCCRTCPSTSS